MSETAPPAVSQLIRCSIIVADLGRARRFYEEVLGHTAVYWQGTLDGPTLWHLLGTEEGARCKAAILKREGEPDYGMVGLFEVADVAHPALPEGGNAARIGEGVLVFYCEDLDRAIALAEARGGRVTAPPVNLEHNGKVKQREMCLRDPDGHLINLIEWNPASPRKPELEPGDPV